MSHEAREVRDLARQVEELCRAHPAYSMTWDVIRNTVDHLNARARVIELTHENRK